MWSNSADWIDGWMDGGTDIIIIIIISINNNNVLISY